MVRHAQAAALARRQVGPGDRGLCMDMLAYVWYMQSFTEGYKKETDA